MFNKPFSKRQQPPPTILKYDIPLRVRKRILNNFANMQSRGAVSLEGMVSDALEGVLLAHGEVQESSYSFVHIKRKDEVALEHFQNCSDDQAIDFIEFCFHSQWYRLGQQGVDIINDIFRDEGIGYEFSPYAIHSTQMDNGGYRVDSIQYPQGIKKSNELVQSTTIEPTLQLLASQTFKTANQEMLEAHKHLRHGEYTAAINSAGQALETVLKTICEKKRWTYTKDKDALGKLLQVVQQKGLIFDIYNTAIQKTSGEVRNKFGAHGKGPDPTYGFATAEQAEHMIQVTSAHILLLVRLAKL